MTTKPLVKVELTVYCGNREAAERLVRLRRIVESEISTALFRLVDDFAREKTLSGFMVMIDSMEIK